MESKTARDELNDLERMRAAVTKEARKAPWWAFPTMFVGFVAYIGSLKVIAWQTHDVRGVVWIAFVVTWVYLMNRGKRVLPGRLHTRAETVRNFVLVAVWFIVLVSVQIAIGRNISWGWATAFIGVTATGTGLFLGWLNHRQP